VLLHHDIDFINPYFVTCGGAGWYNRLPPFIQYFNIEKIHKNKISYISWSFPAFRTYQDQPYDWDTGTPFYVSLTERKLPVYTFIYDNYIYHNEGSSYREESFKR
jgi:hypothetical protein